MTFSQAYLPIELWQNVFRQIGNPIQLLQCGMVCKTWKTFIDRLMYKEIKFGQLTIKKNGNYDAKQIQQIYNLYQHLLKRPDLCQRIQVITLGRDIQGFSFAKDLLKLAITSNIRILDGDWDEDDTLRFLRNTLSPACKIAQLPHIVVRDVADLNWIQCYKETLTTISLDISSSNSRMYVNYGKSPLDRSSIGKLLGQMKSLTRFGVVLHGLQKVQELEDLLQDCCQIKELELQIEEIPEYIQAGRGALEGWLSNSVQPLSNLKSLSVVFTKKVDHYLREDKRKVERMKDLGEKTEEMEEMMRMELMELMEREYRTYGPDWIEYLAFKYPNIKALKIKNKSTHYEHIALPHFGNAEYYDLKNWTFYKLDMFESFINKSKSQSNSVRIECIEPIMGRRIICEMDTHINTCTKHTTFTLRIPSSGQKEVNTAQALPHLSTISIDSLDITSSDESAHIGLTSHLKDLAFIRRLRFGSFSILYEDIAHDLNLAITTSIELDTVHVDPRTIAQLSKFAPKLENLKIQNCIYGHQINVPFSNLKMLTLSENDRIPIKDCRLRGNVFISVSSAGLPQQCFMARSRSMPIVQMSQQEYELYSDKTNSIHINCKSLKCLIVYLDHVSFTLQFDDQGKVKKGNPSLTMAPGLATLNAKYIALEEKSRLSEQKCQSLDKMYSQAKQYLTQAQIQAIEGKSF